MTEEKKMVCVSEECESTDSCEAEAAMHAEPVESRDEGELNGAESEHVAAPCTSRVSQDSEASDRGAGELGKSETLEAGNSEGVKDIDDKLIDKEEARLDALDATPENRRRSFTILTIIVVLLILTIVMVICYPPLSWNSKKKDSDNFRILSEITQNAVLSSSGVEAGYRAIVSEKRYRLKLTDKSFYASGATTRTDMTSEVLVDRPQRSVAEDAVTIQLANVEAHVFDGDKEISLAGAGRMLAGVSLYARLMPHEGLSSVVPDANINPQVARVLFIVSDVLHYVWGPLPERIEAGAEWRFEDKKESDTPLAYRRFGNVRAVEVADGGERIKLETSFEFSRADLGGLDGERHGGGQVESILEHGILKKAQGRLHRPTQGGEGAESYEILFEFEAL